MKREGGRCIPSALSRAPPALLKDTRGMNRYTTVYMMHIMYIFMLMTVATHPHWQTSPLAPPIPSCQTESSAAVRLIAAEAVADEFNWNNALDGAWWGAEPERVSVFGTLIIFLFMGIPYKREVAEESSLSFGIWSSKVLCRTKLETEYIINIYVYILLLYIEYIYSVITY